MVREIKLDDLPEKLEWKNSDLVGVAVRGDAPLNNMALRIDEFVEDEGYGIKYTIFIDGVEKDTGSVFYTNPDLLALVYSVFATYMK